MEVDDPECAESDPEDEGQPDNEDLAKRGGDGEEEEVEEEVGVDEDSGTEEESQDRIEVEEEDWHTCSEDEAEEEGETAGSSSQSPFHNSSRLLHKDQLLDIIKAFHNGPRCKDGQLTVGLVGISVYNLPHFSDLPSQLHLFPFALHCII